MAFPDLHNGPNEGTPAPDAHEDETTRPSPVRVTVIVQTRHTFGAEPVTGRRIKEAAGIPAAFTLYRRERGGPAPIADEEQVQLNNGDHLFARPTNAP